VTFELVLVSRAVVLVARGFTVKAVAKFSSSFPYFFRENGRINREFLSSVVEA